MRALLVLLLTLVSALGRPAALPDAGCCERTVIRTDGFAPVQPVHTAQTATGIVAFAPLDGGPPPGPRPPRASAHTAPDAWADDASEAAIRALEHARLDHLADIGLAQTGLLPAFSNTPPPTL